MARRLRVFVSSTMRDLANERDAVCRKLEEFNLEPVNAEAILPTGLRSWETVRDDIHDSDLFVLILGERYGWIPDRPPHADAGKSVTELEYDEAHETGLPVFPFFKQLPADFDRTSEEGQRVERFRAKVADWEQGRFRAEFALARELGEKVPQAILTFLGGHYQRGRAPRDRAPEARSVPVLPDVPTPARAELPPELVEAVGRRSPLLLVGAGASLQAGLPSQALFAEVMEERIRRVDPGYRPLGASPYFNAVATDFDSLFGGMELAEVARDLVDPVGAEPTPAHLAAVELFDAIVTTNFDLLLERALAATGRDVEVVAGDAAWSTLPAPVVVKLHGSIDDEEPMALTEAEVIGLAATKPNVWRALTEALRTRPLLAVGTSLRDPSLVALLEQVGPDLHGWVVVPVITRAERLRFARWRLEPVTATADELFAALERALPPRA